jgi:hypothetical protein
MAVRVPKKLQDFLDKLPGPKINLLLEHGPDSHPVHIRLNRTAVCVSLSSRITNHALCWFLNPVVEGSAVLFGACFANAFQHAADALLDLGP